MKREHIIQFLDAGKSFGIQFVPGDPECIGWVYIRKFPFNERIFNLFSDDPDSSPYKSELANRDTPFMIVISEMPESAYEGDPQTTNEDYRRHEVYRFATFEDAEAFLTRMNFTVEDIRWLSEIRHE